MEHVIYNSETDTEGYFYDDEKGNLNIPIDGDIIVIADLGLWNGRKSGYRMLDNNVNRVLSVAEGEYFKLTYDSDTDEVEASDCHHDGTNYYTFREVRKGKDISILQDLIYRGEATDEDIDKYTKKLGKYVRGVYGWKRTRPRKAA